MNFESRNPVLVSIDMQVAFDSPPWTGMDNPNLDENAGLLLWNWRRLGLPIIHIQHDSIAPNSPLAAGLTGNALRRGSEPRNGEPLLSKSINCAFTGTDLDLRLRRLEAREIVIYGLSLDMCVSTSVRIGANLGYQVTLVEDASAAFDLPGWNGGTVPAHLVRSSHLATLKAEFCNVSTTMAVLSAIDDHSAKLPVTHKN